MLKVFLRHRGELTALAKSAGVKLSTVSKWFNEPRHPSANIESKAKKRLLELLELEKAERLAQQAETNHIRSLIETT